MFNQLPHCGKKRKTINWVSVGRNIYLKKNNNNDHISSWTVLEAHLSSCHNVDAGVAERCPSPLPTATTFHTDTFSFKHDDRDEPHAGQRRVANTHPNTAGACSCHSAATEIRTRRAWTTRSSEKQESLVNKQPLLTLARSEWMCQERNQTVTLVDVFIRL